MTLDEFLVWDAPGPGRWQLIDGVPVAMSPAGTRHGVILATITSLVRELLVTRDSPCVMLSNPGIIPAFRAGRNFFIPDLAVTCTQADIGGAGLRGISAATC
jgi:Uma2 family endonuclease